MKGIKDGRTTISEISYLFGQGKCFVIRGIKGNSQSVLKSDAYGNHQVVDFTLPLRSFSKLHLDGTRQEYQAP